MSLQSQSVPWSCKHFHWQLHELAKQLHELESSSKILHAVTFTCRSMSLHSVPGAYMKYQELACSFMSLYAVPFFVWAAHKNFAVLVWVHSVYANFALIAGIQNWTSKKQTAKWSLVSFWKFCETIVGDKCFFSSFIISCWSFISLFSILCMKGIADFKYLPSS